MLWINELSKTYKVKNNTVYAVRSLNLKISNGKVVCFLGPNGAGKTTAIKMLCGLVTPTTGRVELDGINLFNNRKKYLKKIGVVLEGARNIYWRLTPFENMDVFCRIRGLSGNKIRKRINHYLEIFDLARYRNIECRYLSRGNQQKVAVASVLSLDAEVLLLDEPTLGLDLESSKKIMDIVSEEKMKNRIIIVTTHHMEFVETVADRIAFFNHGRMQDLLSPRELMINYSADDNKFSTACLNLLNRWH